jgi:hypothetical protein
VIIMKAKSPPHPAPDKPIEKEMRVYAYHPFKPSACVRGDDLDAG